MNPWDVYNARFDIDGETRRETMKRRNKRLLSNRIFESLSYFSVTVDGVRRKVCIVNSDNLDEKTMLSMPGEDFDCGGIVDFANNKWLIEEKDANNEIYTRCKLRQCNYLLKWIDSHKVIKEQWCHVEDGTKYLTGELEDKLFIASRGDARIAVKMPRNEDTVKLGRTNRFIIDDPESQMRMVFTLSKPIKTGRTHNGKGILSYVMQEVVSTDDDNFELGIADYYKYFPKEDAQQKNDSSDEQTKKVWL